MSGKQSRKSITKQSKKARKQGLKKTSRMPRVKRSTALQTVDNSLRIKRSELLMTVPVTANTVKKGHLAFNINNYPPWLKKMTTLYEMISFEKISIRIISNYATTQSGSYFVGFNSSYSDTINDSTLTSAEIIQQRNAKTANIYTNSTIYIPRTTFQLPYKRYLCDPTTTDADALEKTWFFDFMYYFDTSASGNFTVMIDYEATLYTPAIRS